MTSNPQSVMAYYNCAPRRNISLAPNLPPASSKCSVTCSMVSKQEKAWQGLGMRLEGHFHSKINILTSQERTWNYARPACCQMRFMVDCTCQQRLNAPVTMLGIAWPCNIVPGHHHNLCWQAVSMPKSITSRRDHVLQVSCPSKSSGKLHVTLTNQVAA